MSGDSFRLGGLFRLSAAAETRPVAPEKDSARSSGSSPQSLSSLNSSLSPPILSPFVSGATAFVKDECPLLWDADKLRDIGFPPVEDNGLSFFSSVAGPSCIKGNDSLPKHDPSPESDTFPEWNSAAFGKNLSWSKTGGIIDYLYHLGDPRPYPESMLKGHGHMAQIFGLPHLAEDFLKDLEKKWEEKKKESVIPPQVEVEPSNKNQMYCVFCRHNKEPPKYWMSHWIKDKDGKVTCPILRAYTCPMCQATGDTAHTIKYCPLYKGAKGKKKGNQRYWRNVSGDLVPFTSKKPE